MFVSRNAVRTLVLVLALTVFAVVSASAVASPMPGGQSAKKAKPKRAKRCKSSEVKRTFSYTKGKSTRKLRLTVCVPRAYSKRPASVVAALGKGRAIALNLAPKSIAKLLRGRKARRVAAADGVTDRALARALVPVRAAKVGHDSKTETLKDRDSPPGTKSTQHIESTGWDDEEANPGSALEATTDTTGPGSTKREVIKLSRTMAQCPDAGGIGRGELKFSMKETKEVDKPGGGRVLVEVSLTLDAKVLVHFNDDAYVASVEVVGDWSWVATTRSYTGPGGAGQQLTRHAVGGTHSGTAKADGHGESITTATTNASTSGMVIYGDLFGAVAHMMTEGIVQELVRESAGRAGGGVCAHIAAEPESIHVKPGGSVTIGARLKEAPRPGPIKASQGSVGGTVSPAEAQATPVATFTYKALPKKPPGGKDTVTFTHASNQGRATLKTVTIIYDEDEFKFPQTISGTIAGFEYADGMHTDWDGTLVLQRRAVDPHTGNPDFYPTYEVSSGSVHWHSTLDAPCSGSGDGTLTAAQLSGVLTITPDRTPTGWHWDMLIGPKHSDTTRTLPVDGTCPTPDPPHEVHEDADADFLSLAYNTYGNHPTNYTSPDLVDFTGEGIATNESGNQQWRWRLVGSSTS